jgi:preprotein translocase subunit SecG
MLTVIVVIHLMLVVAMIGVVLLQKSEGGGLVSSTNSGFLTGRGTANVLTRTTALLAAGFFVTSLMLSYIASYERKPTSIIHSGAPAGSEAPGSPAPPLSTGGGVLNQLGGDTPSSPTPAAPAPSGPQVPQSK